MPQGVATVEAVKRGLTRKFDAKMKMQKPFYPKLCTRVRSYGEDESYGWLGAMPQVEEWVGERVYNDLRQANFELTNLLFASGVELPRHKIDDDRYDYFGNVIGKLARRASKHPDKYLFQTIINQAESSVCFDGQFFFDTDHLWGDSGTQSNKLTYDASGPIPTTTEFKSAFNQALIAMMQFKDDRGEFFLEPEADQINELVVCVPPALYEVAAEAFMQQFINDGSVAVSNVQLAKPELRVINHMGSGAAGGSDLKFDVYYNGDELKPYIFQLREPMKRDVKGLDDIEHKYVRFMTEARYNLGYFMWPYAVRTTFI